MALIPYAANFATSPEGLALLGAAYKNAPSKKQLARLLTKNSSQKKKNRSSKQLRGMVDSSFKTYRAPVAYNVVNQKSAAKFKTVNGRTVCCNREFLTTIGNSAAFNIIEVPIQPGLPDFAPWLSKTANNYQRYHIRKLVFTYVPACSTNTPGRVALAYTIDPLDPTPTTLSEIYQYPTSREGAIWSEVSLAVPLRERQSTLYVRKNFVPDTDVKTYDYGKVFIVLSLGDGETIGNGQLFVDYEIELMTPKPSTCIVNYSIVSGPGVAANSWFGGYTENNPVYFANTNVNAFTTTGNIAAFNFKSKGFYTMCVIFGASTNGSITNSTVTRGDVALVRKKTVPGAILIKLNILESDSVITFTTSGFAGATTFDIFIAESGETNQLVEDA